MKPTGFVSPLHEDATHESAWKHVTGQALYINDMPEPPGMLVTQILTSPIAHGKITKLDVSKAAAHLGIAAVITSRDIPGDNDVSAIASNHDEPLLATDTVNCVGQAIAIVVGESYAACKEAIKDIVLEIEPLDAVFETKEAVEKNSLHPGCHIIARGDLEKAWAEADFELTGEIESPGQEHWYLETHCAQAQLNEDEDLVIYASSQNPNETQAVSAHICGIHRSRVTVIMPRMGGGFGGKETQAAHYAAMASLSCWITKRPVRVWLDRDQDMAWSGKRHPFYSKYRAAFDKEGHILGMHVVTYANSGWAQDLSRSILDRCLFHLDSSYYIPNLHFEGYLAKTNLPSNTAFRGFGGPQGFVVTETVMNRAARKLHLDPVEIRKRNYYGDAPRNKMQYEYPLEDFRIPAMTEEILKTSKYFERKAEIDSFNARNKYVKRGIGFEPVKFGISFTASLLNQAGALVLIYTDGSVQINHGGSEMGQGLNTKMIAIAAHDLGVKPNYIRHMSTRTDKVPNASATAASSGTDLNGGAIHNACLQLKQRLQKVAAKMFEIEEKNADSIVFEDGLVKYPGKEPLTFKEVVSMAYVWQVSLSASGYYRTPDIGYNSEIGRGRPFYYYTYGVCVEEIELNVLTGEHRLLDVEIINDCGDSIIPNIDIGQVEGAFAQGYGWLTTEELLWNPKGELLTHSPATYKIPTLGSLPDPEHFRVRLLPNATSAAIHGSKAVGEPPFVLGCATIQALEHAICGCGNPDRDPQIHWPATSESVLRAIYAQLA